MAKFNYIFSERTMNEKKTRTYEHSYHASGDDWKMSQLQRKLPKWWKMKQSLSSTLSTPLSKQSKQVNSGERENNTRSTLWIVPMAKFLESYILFTIIHFSGSLSPTTFTEYDVHEFNAKFQTRCKIKSCKQSFEMWHQLKIKYS